MIRVDHLTKRYGTTTAVRDLSFEIQPGRVTGFLGPNGSGKSTTMRCIVGLDRPTSGNATIGGQPYSQLPSPLTTVGALLDGKAFHPNRTARQQLQIVADTHGIPKKRVSDVLELTGISNVADKRLRGFSLGMGQRLGIALAILADPEVLILDEPINGLDPDGVRWVRSLVRDFAQRGRTVFVSSHLMSEMAVTADDLIIIGRGELIAQGPIRQFTESASHTTVHVAGPHPDDIDTVLSRAALRYDRQAPSTEYPYGRFNIPSARPADIGHLAYTNNLELHELSESHSSLEDIFMELTKNAVEYNFDPTAPGMSVGYGYTNPTFVNQPGTSTPGTHPRPLGSPTQLSWGYNNHQGGQA
ncbi:ABC transporter ATP-binding protein [Arcanobacterium haemolyticum]|nr:ABC transporter ATP-binding protein [Arcanobacterium haemolyticum]